MPLVRIAILSAFVSSDIDLLEAHDFVFCLLLSSFSSLSLVCSIFLYSFLSGLLISSFVLFFSNVFTMHAHLEVNYF